MCFAADPQFVLEHGRCTPYVAIALGNLLKRRREEGRVAGMAEHAMLLINKRGGLGLGERCVIGYQQQRKQARGKKRGDAAFTTYTPREGPESVYGEGLRCD